jgi:hypothetical protein
MNTTELETMLVSQGRRIATLESEIVALKANGQRKFAQAPPASHAAEPEGVRIMHPIERAKIAMPSTAELEKILKVVLAVYPKLRPYSPGDRFADQDAAEFFREFHAAFTFISHLGRAEYIDTKRSISWWAGEATEWWRLRKAPGDINSSPLLAAVVAAGDVNFTQRDEFGNVWAFALVTFGGRPATEAWRNGLRGQLLSPLPGAHSATPSSSGVRISVG